MIIQETPYFFKNGSYNLFGIYYRPDKNFNGEGFVFVDPFAEEKLWTQRVMVMFARKLASLGYAVLRFDIMGHGDSDGNFEDATVETSLSDIRCAIAWLEKKTERIEKVSLLGLRFGATLAMIATNELTHLNRLVLWDPIINGEKYMKEILRNNLVTQTAVYKEIRYTRDDMVNIMKEGGKISSDGYQIAYPFFNQASSINLLASEENFLGQGLIVQIGSKNQKIKQDIVEFMEKYKNFSTVAVIEEPFWKEIKKYYPKADHLYGSTLSWLEDMP